MIANEEVLEAIGAHGLLKDLDPHHLHRLAGLALEASFEPGHIIFHEGDPAGFFYLISSGNVALESGGETIETLGPGDALGWSSLIEGEHKHFQAQALTPVTAFAFDGAEVRRVSNDYPDFGYAIVRRLLPVLADRVEAARHLGHPAQARSASLDAG